MPQVASWGKGKLCKRVDLWHLRFTKTQCKDNKLTKKCMAISDFIRLRKLGICKYNPLAELIWDQRKNLRDSLIKHKS